MNAGCETWPLTLNEEHRFRVFENRMLRRNIWIQRGRSGGKLEEIA
jgi:hypothetical protein